MNRHIRASATFVLGLGLAVFLTAQQAVVVSLTGTYDLDQDGLSEFLALETAEEGDKYPRRVAYKEIDADGAHFELWQFVSRQPLRDARIADTDGDGTPEAVVMEIPAPGTVSINGPWLHVFPWTQGQFSAEPAVEWGDRPGTGQLALRPSHFAVLDIENDGTDEVAVALASPRREIVILTLESPGDVPRFASRSLPLSDEISSGYGHILLVSGDQNQDGYTDLLILNKELDRIEVQVFEGTGSDLLPGPVRLESTAELQGSFSGIIPGGLTRVDTDRDGSEELLVPFRTGATLAISLEAGRLRLTPLEAEVAALFSFPQTALEPSHLNDILLARAELGITGRKIRQLKMVPTGVPAEETVAAPEAPAPEVEAETAPEAPARKIKRLELETVEKEEEAAELPEQPAEAVEEPAAPRRVRKVDLEALTREKAPEAPPGVKIEIPPGTEITDTVRVGQTFRLPLELQEGEKLHAFRPTSLPGGASFDPATRAITWTPTVAQVGLHTLTYDLEYELAGEVAVEETGEAVQVVKKTETRTVQRTILVLEATGE
ncbi:MAG: Ig domain-containing protein [Fidelibacterota bacterium]